MVSACGDKNAKAPSFLEGFLSHDTADEIYCFRFDAGTIEAIALADQTFGGD
jgi:hypothetical protein